MGKFKSMS